MIYFAVFVLQNKISACWLVYGWRGLPAHLRLFLVCWVRWRWSECDGAGSRLHHLLDCPWNLCRREPLCVHLPSSNGRPADHPMRAPVKPASLCSGWWTWTRGSCTPLVDFRSAGRTESPVVKLCLPHLDDELAPEKGWRRREARHPRRTIELVSQRRRRRVFLKLQSSRRSGPSVGPCGASTLTLRKRKMI